MLNEDLMAKAIWQCLKENDVEALFEIIEGHLDAVNIAKLSKNAKLPRSTLYSALNSKNMSVKTLAKLIHAFSIKEKLERSIQESKEGKTRSLTLDEIEEWEKELDK